MGKSTLINTNLHSFLVFRLSPSSVRLPALSLSCKGPPCEYRRPDKLDSRCACDPPYLYAYASSWCPWECQKKFYIPRYPALWNPKQGTLSKPKLQEEPKAVGAQPARHGDGAIERLFEGFEGCSCCKIFKLSDSKSLRSAKIFKGVLIGK